MIMRTRQHKDNDMEATNPTSHITTLMAVTSTLYGLLGHISTRKECINYKYMTKISTNYISPIT